MFGIAQLDLVPAQEEDVFGDMYEKWRPFCSSNFKKYIVLEMNGENATSTDVDLES